MPTIRQAVAVLGCAWLIAMAPIGCGSERGAAVPSDARNTLSWTAATEAGVYGYLVYRSEDRAGPYLRVNPEIVHVPEDGAEQHSYTWVDENVEPGRTYYYYLDVVTVGGIKNRFSGIISRTTPEPER